MTPREDRQIEYDAKADYALGRSEAETRRLIVQSEVLRPFTARLLATVDLNSGMRVLDLGCGAGDVAIAAARIVGNSGAVVAIDHDGAILATACKRAEASGFENISFREIDVAAFDDPQLFDVVIGRCVAFFQPDPAVYLKTAAKAVRPGGWLAIQEPHASWLPVHAPDPRNGQFSAPRIDDLERVGEAFGRAMVATAPSHDVGIRLAYHFARAGLPEPELSRDVPVGFGPDTPLYALAAASFHSMYPRMAKNSITGFDDLATDELEQTLRTQAVQNNSQISLPYSLFSAWVKL